MEENVIVFKYKEQFAGEDFYLTFPSENEIAYGKKSNQDIFVINGTDMSKAHQELNNIAVNLVNNKFVMTEVAQDFYNQGVIPTIMKKSVLSEQLILS